MMSSFLWHQETQFTVTDDWLQSRWINHVRIGLAQKRMFSLNFAFYTRANVGPKRYVILGLLCHCTLLKSQGGVSFPQNRKMQLTTEQRVFVVTEWLRTGSLQQVSEAFGQRFPDRAIPAKSTLWKNIRKYQREGTSLNLNKGRSGRRRTARTDENIRAVRELLQRDPHVSVRRNGLGIRPTSFHNIVRLDIRWYPYKMHRRHELLDADLPRRLRFCQWFLDQHPRFIEDLVIGDEAAFFMNGRVNNQNVREYAPMHHPPYFNFDVNMDREKVSLWIGLCGDGTLVGPCFFNGNQIGRAHVWTPVT